MLAESRFVRCVFAENVSGTCGGSFCSMRATLTEHGDPIAGVRDGISIVEKLVTMEWRLALEDPSVTLVRLDRHLPFYFMIAEDTD